MRLSDEDMNELVPRDFIVARVTYDAGRPWAVVCTTRTFNKTIDRYPTEAQAKRRARALNARNQ